MKHLCAAARETWDGFTGLATEVDGVERCERDSQSHRSFPSARSATQNLLRAARAASAVLTADKAAALLATAIATPRYGFERHSTGGSSV